MENYTPINHADIFDSQESFDKILGPTLREDGFLGCTKVGLQKWHLFSDRGVFSVYRTQEDGKPQLMIASSVSPGVPMELAIERGWVSYVVISEDFEQIKKFFVNKTLFSNADGMFEIVNGPKEFIWTFREPSENAN